MLVALILLPIATISTLGGVEQTTTILAASNPDYANLFKNFSWLGFISLMAWGLGYFWSTTYS